MNMTVQELARAINLEIVGGDSSAVIQSAANLEQAGPGQLSFVGSGKYATQAATCRASALVVPRDMGSASVPATTSLLLADDPEIGFIRCLELLYPRKPLEAGIDPRAHVDASAVVGEGTSIEAGVTVGRGVRIGKQCMLYGGCHVGDGVEIGDHCVLHPNVVLYPGTVLDENVTIHAGTVIGSDGFGYKLRQGVHIKFPQVGTVRVERDVEIGSNTCIDCAALGQTVIGAGTKIDNHVHIAHNVQVGKGVLICGQAGIGGSTVIEDYAVLVSQSGVADHVRVGRGAVVLAQSGVISDIPAGAEVVGFPATDRRQAMRETVTLRKLVELYKPLKALVDLLPRLTGSSR